MLSETERTSTPLLRGRFTVTETSSTDRPRCLMRHMTTRSPSSTPSSNRFILGSVSRVLLPEVTSESKSRSAPSADGCAEVELRILPGGSDSCASQGARLLPVKVNDFCSDPAGQEHRNYMSFTKMTQCRLFITRNRSERCTQSSFRNDMSPRSQPEETSPRCSQTMTTGSPPFARSNSASAQVDSSFSRQDNLICPTRPVVGG